MSRKISIVVGCLLFALLALPVVAGAYSEWVHQFQYSWRGWDSASKDGRIVITGISSRGPAPMLRVGDEVVAFQINDQDSKAGGGSCFGDSGGPVFLGNLVLGDASYVNSFSCNATAGYQRVDTAHSRAFLDQFLDR